MEIFLDGNRDAELDHNLGTPIKGHSYIALGRHLYYVNPFSGIMDEVRIWRTVRTKTEIQDNMWVGSVTGDESDLVSYWNFDEGTGRILNDNTPVKTTALYMMLSGLKIARQQAQQIEAA